MEAQNEIEMEYGNERDQSAAIQRDFCQGFHDIVATFEAAIGHPDMNWFSKNVAAAKTFAELGKIVQGANGPSELSSSFRNRHEIPKPKENSKWQ